MDDQANQTGAALYEADFYSWTQEQAALLRDGRVSAADLTHIAEELETLGRSELAALVSAYKLVAQHLLKLMRQPDMATASWETTIKRERGHIQDLLDDNPGLKSKQDAAFAKGYVRGRRDAAEETGLGLTTFPSEPPFTREQAESFWPKGFPRRTSPRAKKTKPRP